MKFKDDLDIKHRDFLLWKYSDSEARFVIKDPRKAYRVNRSLKQYPNDVKFTEGDEPQFKLGTNQLGILSGIGIKFNTFDIIES